MATLQQILQAEDIEDLKKLGKFFDLKKAVESQLMLILGVNGWASLYRQLKRLERSISSNKDSLYRAAETNDFKSVRYSLSETMGFTLTVKSQADLDTLIKNCLAYAVEQDVSPYKHFEDKKIKNFINSSKLEGIHLPFPESKASLESVLAKHRR